MESQVDFNIGESQDKGQGEKNQQVFTKQDLKILIQNHDQIVNPKNNENAKRIGCQKSDFEILEALGKGAHGTALRVRSVKNGQQYVMKQIDFSTTGPNPLKPSYKRQALREVQLLMHLQSHPHVIKYYNSFLEDECLHIIMEYAEKGDLQRYVRQVRDSGQQINESLIWLMAFQICLGVGYLHTQKTVHRDLKCMNILLTKEDVIKIGDFGVAKILNTNRVDKNQQQKIQQKNQIASKVGRVGTPLYLSPEVIKQVPYDYKVDSWAVGCCIHHLAALEPPFQCEDLNLLAAKILTEAPKSLNSQHYSDTLNRFVNFTLLQKEPEQRPYITYIMKNARHYFSDETMKQYREKILPIIKSRYSGQDVDYIYQVLIDGDQYKTTHNFFKRNSKDSPSKERQTNEQIFMQSQFNFNQDQQQMSSDMMMRSTQSRFLQLFPQSQQKKFTNSIGCGSRALKNLVAKTKLSNQSVNTSSMFSRPKSRQPNFEQSTIPCAQKTPYRDNNQLIKVESFEGHNSSSIFRRASVAYQDNIIEAPNKNQLNETKYSTLKSRQQVITGQDSRVTCAMNQEQLRVETPKNATESTYEDHDPPPPMIAESPIKQSRVDLDIYQKAKKNAVLSAAQAYHRQVVNLEKQRNSYINQDFINGSNRIEFKVDKIQRQKTNEAEGDDVIDIIEQVVQAQILLSNGGNRAMRQSLPDAQNLLPQQLQQKPVFSQQKFNLKSVQECYNPPQTAKPFQAQTIENVTVSTGTTTIKGSIAPANLPPQANSIQIKQRSFVNNIQSIQQSRAEKAQSTGLRIKKQSQVVFPNQLKQPQESSSQGSTIRQQDSRNEGIQDQYPLVIQSNKITINQDQLFEAYHLNKMQKVNSPAAQKDPQMFRIQEQQGVRKTYSILQQQKQHYPPVFISAQTTPAPNSFLVNNQRPQNIGQGTSCSKGGSRNIVNPSVQTNVGLYSNLANQAKSNIRLGTAGASPIGFQPHIAKYMMINNSGSISSTERPENQVTIPTINRTHNQIASQSSKRPTVRDLARITSTSLYQNINQ